MASDPLPEPVTLPQRVATVANVYYTPLLVGLGSIGNVLSIFVLLRSKIRRQSTCQYLSALAVSDTLFLLLLIPPWLGLVTPSDVFRRPGFCQFFVYLSYVSCCSSAWLVMGFTIERWIAVMYPLRRAAWCTVLRARLMVAAAVILSLVTNSPLLWFTSTLNGDCGIEKDFMVLAAYFNASDTLVAFTAPMFIITVLNTVITYKVRRISFVEQQRPPQLPLRTFAQSKITRMLLTVSTVFVLLNLPAYIMRILAYAIHMEDNPGILQAMQQVSQMFFNTNFGINFILYCLTGQNFRRAFFKSIPCLRRRLQHSDAVRRAASPNTNRNNSISTSAVSVITETAASRAVTSLGRSYSVLRRWRFDNTRQQQTESFEMAEYAPTLPQSNRKNSHLYN